MEREKVMSVGYLTYRVLGTPLWALLAILSMILYKEFHISPLLLTFLVTIKPASALLASGLSAYFFNQKKNLVKALALLNCARFLPFFSFYTVQTPWIMVLVFGIYMVLSRASVPAWMELFRTQLPKEKRSRIFLLGNSAEYVGMIALPLSFGLLLDHNGEIWRLLFPLGAALGMLSTLFLIRIPPLFLKPTTLAERHPWKRTWKLISSNRGFLKYQIGFMLGGAGLMIVQPVLPIFFVDRLSLSYTEVVAALALCKGAGYALTSPLWSRLFNRMNILTFSSAVPLLASLFIPLLLGATHLIALLYIAYISYGVMQAGSELSWHMSAVTFAGEKESLPYSETNILCVGVRGLTIPYLGAALFSLFGMATVMILGALLCLSGSIFLRRVAQQQTTAHS